MEKERYFQAETEENAETKTDEATAAITQLGQTNIPQMEPDTNIHCLTIVGPTKMTTRAMPIIKKTYKMRMASTLGIFCLSRKSINGANKKNKKPEIIIGKNNVVTKMPIGSKRNEIFVQK